MSEQHLAIYLNDHLSGAVGALELLSHLETAHAGQPLESFIHTLRTDIMEDRQELENIMARLHIGESRPRQAAAWLAEKFAQLKLRLDDSAAGDMRLFESLEAVAVGIEGKRALWRALASAADSNPGLQGVDYQRLERRADEQRHRVENVRLEVARTVLAMTPPADARRS